MFLTRACRILLLPVGFNQKNDCSDAFRKIFGCRLRLFTHFWECFANLPGVKFGKYTGFGYKRH